MKAKDFNGTIKVYSRVPKSYNNIIGFNHLSDSDLESHGFYNIVTPTYNEKTEVLGDIYFDSENSCFTYPVNSITFSQSLSEMKTEKIEELKSIYNSRLGETDWYIIREAEGGAAAPQSVLDQRSALRTECATKEAEINAKTTKASLAEYVIN